MAKLRHIALAVPDIERAARFYERSFGLQRVKQTELRIYLSDGTVNLTLLPSDDLAGEQRRNFVGLHHLGFVVDDVAETCKRLEENAGRPVDVPSAYTAANAERKYWDPHGVMLDVAATYWVGSR